MEKAGLKFVRKYIHPEIEPEVVIYGLNKDQW
jgi:hypothetical protein